MPQLFSRSPLDCMSSWACLVAAACGGPGADGAVPAEAGESSAADEASPDYAATWRDGRLSRKELEGMVADELRRMHISYEIERHDLLHRTLDGVLEERLLATAAARRGYVSVKAMLSAEVETRVEPPSEEALRAAFERFREEVPSATWEAAKPYLVKELMRSAVEQQRAAFVDTLREELGVEVHLPFPDIPRVDVSIDPWDPTLGPDDASVTIVEFGGYQCYYCKRMHETVLEALDRWPDDVRLVFKDFPLAGHEHANQAAYAAHCAARQGRWQEMASLLLSNQGRLDADHLRNFADTLGLQPDAWQDCMEDPVWGTRIEQDVHAGRQAGVTSTPTFFVNGLMVVGAQDRHRFHDVVAQELARAR